MITDFLWLSILSVNFCLCALPSERADKFTDVEVEAVVNGILLGQSTQRSVEMTNELSEPLQIDCGSEEDDLGNLTIKPHHRIVWSFPVTEETWYECELTANGGRHKIFEIFPGPRKIGLKKKRLQWIIRADGIYEGDEFGNWVLHKPKRWHVWKY
ncbi:unnamed protein product, partial [Mesorhabditis belari]|uniref:S-protein homolog n=1 Tax=Mesorhabditis belari TaxID=2138241 RepID=A0AAF3ETG4_9BILA